MKAQQDAFDGIRKRLEGDEVDTSIRQRELTKLTSGQQQTLATALQRWADEGAAVQSVLVLVQRRKQSVPSGSS